MSGVPPVRARRLPLIAWSTLLLLPPALLFAAGCREGERPNLNPPDSLLQAELGLTPADHVHRILLGSSGGLESVEPLEVELEPGDYVEFFTTDRRVRLVSFVMDSLTEVQSEFLRATAQDRSPPLVEIESRFVVSFRDAPHGRYPFLVDGNERSILGAVVVGLPEPVR